MSTPAGWHPDPENPGMQRYWDGVAWTEHRAEAPQPVPQVTDRYEYATRVNKGYVRSNWIDQQANTMGAAGFRLVHAFEQSGNAVLIFERKIG